MHEAKIPAGVVLGRLGWRGRVDEVEVVRINRGAVPQTTLFGQVTWWLSKHSGTINKPKPDLFAPTPGGFLGRDFHAIVFISIDV